MDLNLQQMQKYGTEMLKDITEMCEKRNISYCAIYGTLLGTVRHNGPIPWDCDVDIYVPENQLKTFLNAVKEEYCEKYWIDYRDETTIPRAFPRIGLKGYETEILHIDVFRMSGLPNGKLMQKVLTFCGRSLFVVWKAKTLDLKFYYPDLKRRIYATVIKTVTFPFSVNLILKKIDRLCSKYEVMSTDFVGRMMGRRAIYPTECFADTILHPYADFMIRIPKGYDKLLTQMYGDYMEYPPKEEQDKYFSMTYHVREL